MQAFCSSLAPDKLARVSVPLEMRKRGKVVCGICTMENLLLVGKLQAQIKLQQINVLYQKGNTG